jgi:hypothetical protein
MMPNIRIIKLNTTDHTQSARKRHANASKRRTSSLLEYRLSVALWLTVPSAFKTCKMPQLESAIESKIYGPQTTQACYSWSSSFSAIVVPTALNQPLPTTH